jgi:multidrug efflux pump subunit AcrA (membrane-fusion protein)|tara:strand:- start:560 stop:2743 length:2184 start_codon:yes stop_codon:yes gene_type:complete
MNYKWGLGGAVVVALVLVGTLVWPGIGGDGDSSDSTNEGPTFVVAPVERRTLVDEITVRGEIRRDQLQRITSGVDGRVSTVLVDDGETINAGDVLYAIDGRAAVAVDGEFSFYRRLDVGSDGPDVLQLETILSNDGFDVGVVDQLFTEETRAGLREWQVNRGYGGETPEPNENIVVSLRSNNAGYTIGARNTISFELEPSVPNQPVSYENHQAGTSRSLLYTAGDNDPGTYTSILFQEDNRPRIEVTVNPQTVVEGNSATFTFTSDIVMPTDTVIDYIVTGSATAEDDYDDGPLDGSFIFPQGAQSFNLEIQTLTDDEIESEEEIVIEVGDGFGIGENLPYVPGALREARLAITSPPGDFQTIKVSATSVTVNEGSNVSFEFETDFVSNEDTTITFTVGGTARSGSDYFAEDLEIDLPANAETVTVTFETRDDTIVENDETLSITITSNADETYVVGSPSSASTTIESNDLPELIIEGGGSISEGSSGEFTIRADQPVVEDTSINYALSGSATPGRDFNELSGTVVMPAGQSEVRVTIETIDDDVVFLPGDMVVASWPARVGTVSVDDGEFILLGQEVLTLTEPDFTITLTLNPTNRGNLEVGMAVEVEIQASDEEAVPGIILELDETATVTGDGSERYEGVIETFEVLDAVDGASVNVDVTREEKVDVITVPIAAVLQDGQGNDVVRVVLVDGTTTQVQIETGLSEGAFVEVTEGLAGDELVLVET